MAKRKKHKQIEDIVIGCRSKKKAENFFKRIKRNEKAEEERVAWVKNKVMGEEEFRIRVKMTEWYRDFGFYDVFDLLRLEELKGGK
jgi:hypothetical protein